MKNKVICPQCDEVCRLVSDYNDVYVGKINQKVWINFYSYECDFCETSFTDRECEEKNIIEINKGIRKFKRLIKIKNILK